MDSQEPPIGRTRVALIALTSPAGAPVGAPARAPVTALATEGAASQRSVDVPSWPLTMGRALDNQLVIDDAFVAAHHARIDADDAGALTLTVLNTVNGIEVNGVQVKSGQSVPLGPSSVRLKLGHTHLQLRLPGEVLAPEQALPLWAAVDTKPSRQPVSVRSRAWPWIAGAALFAFEAASQAINLDPGAEFGAWLPALLGVPVALMFWCGVWALLSKLFNHDFDFSGHLKLALPWVLVMALVQALWPQLAAAVALPMLWRLTPLLLAVLAAFWVRAHLSHVLPHKQRAVSVGVAAMALGAIAITAAGNLRSSDSLSSAAYMSTLPLPALRLGSIGDDKKLTDGLAPLAAQLALRVKKARDDEEEGEDGAD